MDSPLINNIGPAKNAGQPKQAAADAAHKKAELAAKQFEALFSSMMLKSMRKAIPDQENEFMPTSLGEKIYTEMLDDEYGNLLGNNGSLGLADLILKQIEGTGNGLSSLSMLNALKSAPWLLDNRFVPSQSSSAPADNTARLTRWKASIEEASTLYKVDKDLISAVIAQESGGNPYAVSPKGAKGLMQLMDTTAKDMGAANVFDPDQNIMAGTKYLRQMLDKYSGNEALALASYNAGPAAVDRYNGIPPFDETQRYVANVLGLRQQIAASAAVVKGSTDNE
jgi:soluble lytic murein transglycosylase-like protein